MKQEDPFKSTTSLHREISSNQVHSGLNSDDSRPTSRRLKKVISSKSHHNHKRSKADIISESTLRMNPKKPHIDGLDTEMQTLALIENEFKTKSFGSPSPKKDNELEFKHTNLLNLNKV